MDKMSGGERGSKKFVFVNDQGIKTVQAGERGSNNGKILFT